MLRVAVGGDGGCCHTGRRSCFYRRVAFDPATGLVRLVKSELTGSDECHSPALSAAGKTALDGG